MTYAEILICSISPNELAPLAAFARHLHALDYPPYILLKLQHLILLQEPQ